ELEDLIQSRAEEHKQGPLIAPVNAPTRTGLTAAERVIRHGAAAGAYGATLGNGDDPGCGQVGVGIGVTVRSGESADEADDVGRGVIRFDLPGSEPAFLDPVLVRRDTSSRWLEGATTPGVTTLEEPNEPAPGEPDRHGGGNEPSPGSRP